MKPEAYVARVLAIVTFLLCLAPTAWADKGVVVGNRKTAGAELDRAAVKKLLTGRTTRWSNGAKVVIVLPPKGSAEMKWLCKKIIGLPEEVYRKHLLQKAFRGKIGRPKTAASSRAAAEAVAATPGAIAPIAGRDARAGLVVILRK